MNSVPLASVQNLLSIWLLVTVARTVGALPPPPENTSGTELVVLPAPADPVKVILL